MKNKKNKWFIKVTDTKVLLAAKYPALYGKNGLIPQVK